jgi:hypothetical protein
MTEAEKLVFRAAGEIRDRLCNLSQKGLCVRLPRDYWQEITRLGRQIEIANARGWLFAARSLRTDLARSVDYFRNQLATLYTQLQQESIKILSLPLLYREILALYEEFEAVDIDFEKHEIVVTTEAITLEGTFLGPFEIRLDWERLGNPSPYSVKALDPHPAASDDTVTHPHVQNETLCEGEGRAAIKNALAEGRLSDFFMLVTQVLWTYGKGSAYIELDEWSGVNCSDCGDSISENGRSYCNHCDSTLCDPCSRSCSACESTFCASCLETCSICDEYVCSTCATTCRNCHKFVCPNCHTNRLCEKCHEQLKKPDEDPSGDPAANECNTPAEPLAVGV